MRYTVLLWHIKYTESFNIYDEIRCESGFKKIRQTWKSFKGRFWIEIPACFALHKSTIQLCSKSQRIINLYYILILQVGSVPHLSREAFDLLTSENQGVQVSIETSSSLEEALQLFQKGITAFSGLDHTLCLVTLKDSGVTTASHYSRNSVSISSRAGKVSITPEKYMNLIETFKPDFFHTLCDGDTDEYSGNKRIYNAVNRTETFFQTCAELYRTSSMLSESMLIGEINISIRK